MTAIYLKTEEEIEGFKRVGFETGRILEKILIMAQQPGHTPLELDELAREEIQKLGAKPAFLGYRGFPAAICVSKGNTMVHGIPDNVPLKKGDIVSVDFGIDMDGFIGDTADTIIVGEFPRDLVLECNFALNQAINEARAGNKLSDISKQISKVAKKNNYLVPENYGGHGIDRHNMHAAPFIPNEPDYVYDFTLREGMVLAIEPMFIDAPSNRVRIADDEWSVIAGGPTAHCEHTVLVGHDCGTPLTRSERTYAKTSFINHI